MLEPMCYPRWRQTRAGFKASAESAPVGTTRLQRGDARHAAPSRPSACSKPLGQLIYPACRPAEVDIKGILKPAASSTCTRYPEPCWIRFNTDLTVVAFATSLHPHSLIPSAYGWSSMLSLLAITLSLSSLQLASAAPYNMSTNGHARRDGDQLPPWVDMYQQLQSAIPFVQ